jgi:hypothetical protein
MTSAPLRARAWWALLIIAAAAVAGSVVLAADATDRFPHHRHARLFPLCTGCHAGIEAGERAQFYPPPDNCTSCHDGTTEKRVEWDGPRPYLTNLAFEHPAHQAVAVARDGAALECEQCHSVSAEARMTIQRANPDVCLSCHGHAATDHFVNALCETCHVPLVETELPAQRLLALPEPTDHYATGFVRELHGAQALATTQRCATCHTRERCLACHVNAADVTQIAALPPAPRDWIVPSYTAHYPEPASHLAPSWLERHGAAASRQECATCHTQQDCTTCHAAPAPEVVATLPSRGEVSAPGAGTERQPPPSHASRFFERDHAALAAASPESCAACHQKQFCADCHDAPLQPSYHPRNFTVQHASAAWGRRLECSSCHEVRTFCRACHVQLGMRTEGRLDPGFHDAEPLWLLRHARAARQGLESCTSCHNQRDCLQCHSTLGAFQVSPHGPDFDARRAQKRNPTICFACHTSDPLKGTP